MNPADESGPALTPGGKVWLVGAGPGDPRLLTLAAREVLAAADVVIHDRLVSEEILLGLGPEVRLIDAGKAPGRQPLPQGEINRLLIAEARAGRRVVRLKGGDPFLFGRGGEEALALNGAGIPWELIPGISSALGVPALAGIPVTHRGQSSSLHIITWRDQAGKPPAPDSLKALAGGTVVILMGGAALGEIGEGFMAAGFAPDTPAAVIENGSSPRQRQRFLPLRDLGAFSGFGPPPADLPPPPVLVVLGQVCALGESLFRPVPRPPLTGRRIVVTHSEPRNGELCRRLRSLGAAVIPFPCIKTRPLEGLAAPDFEAAAGYRWLVFTSAAGVEYFFDGCREAALDLRRFAACRFAAGGPSAAAALRDRGLVPDLEPGPGQGAGGRSLGLLLAERMDPAVPGKALLVQCRRASPALAAVLRERGFPFAEFPVYETIATGGNAAAQGLIAAGAFDAACFSSPSAAASFGQTFKAVLDFSRLKALCIGESTAAAAREWGMDAEAAPEASIEGLCALALGLPVSGRAGGRYGGRSPP